MTKRLIDGLWYNEDTAITLASRDGGGQCASDFGYWYEALMATKKGNLFLYGSGGPLTSYATSCGSNNTCGSDSITPMTKSEAIKWISDNDPSIDQDKVSINRFEKYLGKFEEA